MHETSGPKSRSIDEVYPVFYGNGIYWKNTGGYKKKQVYWNTVFSQLFLKFFVWQTFYYAQHIVWMQLYPTKTFMSYSYEKLFQLDMVGS